SFALVGTSWRGTSVFEELMIDKENNLALSGKVLDGALILESAKAYQTIPDDVYPYYETDEFQENARPYEFVYKTIKPVFTGQGFTFQRTDLETITNEEAYGYYDRRIRQIRANLESTSLYSKENVGRIMMIDDEVEKPFVFDYVDGYDRYFELSQTNTILIIFLICFIVSPIFSNEYQTGTANLILTAKNGKKSQIFAKIFTGITLSTAVVVMLLSTCYIAMLLLYGTTGANAQLQLLIPLNTFHFTLREVCILLGVTTLFGGILLTSVALFLSSATKKSFISLTACVIFNIATMFQLPIYSNFYLKSLKFSPYAMGNFNEMMLQLSFSVFGVELWLYEAVCVVAVFVSGLLLLLTYQKFKGHQVE
ncbi:MAG: hypothetical protein R3Y63_14880, partial [Eubacteriales bacterium]